MRRRFDKLVASFLAVVLCVAFVPLIAIAQNPSEDLTDAGLVTTTESSTDSAVATPAETPENTTGEESSEITEPPAVETPTDETTVEEETTEESGINALLDEPEEEPVVEPQDEFTIASIGSTEYATLQEAIDAANDGDTITMWLDSAQNLTISNKKNLTLDLNGHTITKTHNFSDTGTASVITINSSNVVFKGNGAITGSRSTLSTVSTSTINGVETTRVDNNYVVNTNKKYRVVTANNSDIVFDGPNVTSPVYTSYGLVESLDPNYGNVLYVRDGSLTIKGGKFEGGTTGTGTSGTTRGTLYGATVAVYQGGFNMTGGMITGPGIYRSNGQGGSLYVAGKTDESSVVKITGGVIDNTKKGKKASYGGNIALSNCNAEIGGDVQIKNGYASNGGNVYMSNGSLKVTGGTIAAGTATQKGGGIYVAGKYQKYVSTEIAGGVISGNSVTSIASGNGGGGVYVNYASFDMTGGSIEGNTTKSPNGAGAYLNIVEKANFAGGVISGNTASAIESNGGGIYAKASSYPLDLVIGNTITGNSAGYGAGVSVDNSKAVTFDLSNDARVYNNTATNASNEITGTSRNKTDELLFKNAKNVSFKLNGEAANNYADYSFEMDVTKFTYKIVENGAQVSYYCDEEENITKEMCIDAIVLDPNHNENHPQHYVWNEEEGKAYPATIETDAKAAIDKARETGKTLIVCSQAAFADGEISGVTIERCEANKTGNLFVLSGNVTIKDATIDGKDIAADSAMLYAKSGSSITIESGATIKNANRAETSGSYSGGGALEMAYGQFASNLVINSGAVFENNKIAVGYKGNGGAIWAWHTNITINGGEFKSNYAKLYGGVLFTEWESELSITGGSFDSNSAGSKGGALALFAVYIESGEKGFHGTVSTITGGSFTNNKAYESQYYAGGAIYNGRGCSMNLRSALITGNYKDYGAKGFDAAISNCSTGSLAVYKSQGALITDNGSGNADIALNGSTGNTVATVSDYALGGGDCNWVEPNGRSYQNTNKTFSITSHPSEKTISEARYNVLFQGNSATAQGTAIMNNGSLVIGADTKNLEVKKHWEGVEETDLPDSVEVQLARYLKDGDGNNIKDENGDPAYETLDKDFRDDAIKELNASNGWTAYWTDLSDEFDWFAIEKKVPGYDSTLSAPTITTNNGKAVSKLEPPTNLTDQGAIEAWMNANLKDESGEYIGGITFISYTLTNTWNNELTNISAEKFWDDNNNQYNIRPESIELKLAIDANSNGVVDDEELEATSTKTAKITPNNEGIWRWEFKDLQKYTKKGEEIKYLVKETLVAGYVSELSQVFVAKTDDSGNVVKDEDGNTVYTDATTWLDEDAKEWSGFNITNSLDFADVAFTKTYEGNIYKDANGNGNSTAVFRITGNFNGKDFYNNIVSANFSEAGAQVVEVKGLLVGATYTIEELKFDGSGYTASGDPQTFILTKDGPQVGDADITIEFTNTGDDDETPNTGIINRYSFSAGGTDVEQIRNSQAA